MDSVLFLASLAFLGVVQAIIIAKQHREIIKLRKMNSGGLATKGDTVGHKGEDHKGV